MGLNEFWNKLSDVEKDKISSYMEMSGASSGLLLTSTISATTETPSRFLRSQAQWAIYSKDYELAKKLLNQAEKYLMTAIDRHFMYISLISLHYKIREVEKDALAHAKKCCLEDISLYPSYSRILNRGTAVLASYPSFK